MPRPRFVIEVDDESHYWKDETERTTFLESKGFSILRFDNVVIARNLTRRSTRFRLGSRHFAKGRDPEDE